MRTVVVTGGGKGIGRATCERFAAAGDRVIAVGRSPGAVDEVCDVTDEQAIDRLFSRIGAVDILVNNAGIGESNPLARVTLAEWRRHLEVNATGPFLCTRAVLPGMLERDFGRIVTVASTSARVGTSFTTAYAASKHAALGLMRAVAAEVAGTGVTSNAVCPTFVRTDLTARAVAKIVETTGRTAEASEAALASASPLGRLLEPEEVALAIWYLASQGAGAINGQALVVDGGGVQA